MSRRNRIFLGAVALILLVSALYWASIIYYRAGEIAQASARVSLYQAQVEAEIERFEHLPFILSQDPAVRAASGGAGRETLNEKLRVFAERAGLEAIYLMEPSGLTIAASNAGEEGSFLGQNYGFRPYFTEAIAGRQGVFYGIGATTLRPGFFIAAPVLGPAGDVAAVIAIKLDLGRLAETWAAGGEQVILVNADGVVLLASDPSWLYRALDPLEAGRLGEVRATRQFGDQPLEPLAFEHTGARAVLDGRGYYLAQAEIAARGWRLIYFADERAVQLRASFAVLVAIAAALVALAIWLVQRSERIGADLRASQAGERALRVVNTRLGEEIEERRAAERRLERAQGELARASKLAALGQLATSVTHELGQPIAAMRNHLTAAEIGGQEVPPQLAGLVTRMQKTTEQLRFFARPGREDLEPLEMGGVLDVALELLAPNLEAAKVGVKRSGMGAVVWGNRLRLEQAVTNVLRNAVDAMSEDGGDLSVALSVVGGDAVIAVRDEGPGLAGVAIEELQEPFFTTRASGEGMGLGLAISSEIVKEHGGEIVARDLAEGGAEFVISLPIYDGEDQG